MFTILSTETVGSYRIDEALDRFENPMWFVLDLSAPDWTGLPAIIRQASTRAEALAGLSITPSDPDLELPAEIRAAEYGDWAGWFAQPRDGVAADLDVAASWARLAAHYGRLALEAQQ